jgi:two-component system NtrC family sensor kinase
MIEDISERKRLQEQVIRSDKLAAIGTMVSGVAHEVINPLTGAIGRAELLLRGPLENELRSDVEVIRSEIHRAITTLRDLLYFARAYKPEKSSVSVNAIAESAVALRAYPLRVSGIEVDVDLEPSLPNVSADPHQLQQVFLNILVNAEQAMTAAHGRGRLHLKTRHEGDAVRITIADDGPGIPKEYLDRIFDPFFTTKPVGQGTGLGLSISYGIIKEQGGDMRVDSEVGKGAMFTIELPAVQQEPSGTVEGQRR